MIPGEILVDDGELTLNAGRPVVTLRVANTGDRPIQVGSHYHFAETNGALSFGRAQARGFRLNIAAGTAVRFEPGQIRTVELVALSGARVVYGFTGAVMGPLDARRRVSKQSGRESTASLDAQRRTAKRPAKKSRARKKNAGGRQ